MNRKKPTARPGTLKKVLGYMAAYRLLLVLSLLCAAGSVAMTLTVPVEVGKAIDCIAGAGQVNMAALVPILIRTGIFACAAGAFQWGMTTVNNRISFHVVRDLRNEAFSHLQVLSLAGLHKVPVGDTVNRILSDAEQLGDGLLMGFSQLFTGALTILVTLGLLFSIHWGVGLVVVLLTPVSMFTAKFIAGKTYSLFVEQSKARAEEASLAEEMIRHQKVVQAFSQEETLLERFEKANRRLADASGKAVFFSSLTNPTTRFVNGLVYAAATLVGGLTCIGFGGAAALTVGELSCVLSYANQYTKPFNEIAGVIAELQNSLACAGRLMELLETPGEPDDSHLPALGQVQGEVRLTHVCFSYLPEKPLIQDLNLTVLPGQTVAIVGSTGCGKTTLMQLLLRFYDAQSGKTFIDGTDTASVTRASVRAAFGMVLQDTWLRQGTVLENIALGRPEASRAEILRAAEESRAAEFIAQLPNGYDTVLDENGGNLSAGQKQLLCIARVMLSRPPMLILDEATSEIDTRTEEAVQQAFLRLMEGRTCFVVAHRLSTVRSADKILVMQNGRVVEEGTHDTLLQKGGVYAALYESQFAQ